MMISSSIMIEKQAMKIEKYSHKKSRFCLIQKKLDSRLSLGHSTLARRVRQARNGVTPVARRNPVTEEEMEISRLKRENAELRMERDILKNATAYFAKESLKGTRS